MSTLKVGTIQDTSAGSSSTHVKAVKDANPKPS